MLIILIGCAQYQTVFSSTVIFCKNCQIFRHPSFRQAALDRVTNATCDVVSIQQERYSSFCSVGITPFDMAIGHVMYVVLLAPVMALTRLWFKAA